MSERNSQSFNTEIRSALETLTNGQIELLGKFETIEHRLARCEETLPYVNGSVSAPRGRNRAVQEVDTSIFDENLTRTPASASANRTVPSRSTRAHRESVDLYSDDGEAVDTRPATGAWPPMQGGLILVNL